MKPRGINSINLRSINQSLKYHHHMLGFQITLAQL